MVVGKSGDTSYTRAADSSSMPLANVAVPPTLFFLTCFSNRLKYVVGEDANQQQRGNELAQIRRPAPEWS